MEINVLIAEDDDMLRQLLCDIVRKQGCYPIEARDGEEAIALFFSTIEIHLCILDIMMPIYDGLEVLKEIRNQSEVPIIMLTALGSETHEVRGLLSGANDYISKPFSYPVLIARIENLLKPIRKQKMQKINVGQLEIDLQGNDVRVEGKKIELVNKEFRLLTYLIQQKGSIVTREQILSQIWGYDYEGDVRTIDTHIKMLRKKLGRVGDYIRTARGVGYRFEIHDEE